MKKSQKIVAAFLSLTLAVGLCAGTGNITAKASGNPTLSKTKISINVGETKKLKVKKYKKPVTWSSENTSIATVNNGNVTGVKAGKTVVKALAGSKQLSCKVNVKAAELNLKGGVTETVKGTYHTFTFTSTPKNLDDLKEYELCSPYMTMALYILTLDLWTPDTEDTVTEMMEYLCHNTDTNNVYNAFSKEHMRNQKKQYPYLGASYLNGSTPDNDYTPSTPISVTIYEDSLAPIEKTATTPELHRGFIQVEGADNPRYMSFYKHSKDGNWYIWSDSWKNLTPGMKPPAADYQY